MNVHLVQVGEAPTGVNGVCTEADGLLPNKRPTIRDHHDPVREELPVPVDAGGPAGGAGGITGGGRAPGFGFAP